MEGLRSSAQGPGVIRGPVAEPANAPLLSIECCYASDL
jgi:hypothetical protein